MLKWSYNTRTLTIAVSSSAWKTVQPNDQMSQRKSENLFLITSGWLRQNMHDDFLINQMLTISITES